MKISSFLRNHISTTVKTCMFLLCLFSLVPLSIPVLASTRTVAFPIQLDYSLLQALMIQSAFTDAEQTVQLINEGDGCLNLVLSEPAFSEGEGGVNLSTQVYLHAGTPVGNNCFMPFEWQGSIEVVQRPHLNPLTWELTFETLKTTIYTSDKKQLTSTNIIWKQILPVINDYMQDFSINLAPPVADLKDFLLPLFDSDVQQEAEKMLGTLRPGEIAVSESGMVANVLVDVEHVAEMGPLEPPETLSVEEMEKIIELWETWDSLLVYLVTTLSVQPLSAEEQQILIDLLLDTRHTFVEKINESNVERDFVREQFVVAWKQLSGIFRNHLLHNPEASRVGYLSFFTAADALIVLDELGPTFGIEVSRNGLIRLARIMSEDTSFLNYLPDINYELQELFKMSPTPAGNDLFPEEEIEQSKDAEQDSGSGPMSSLRNFFFATAYAGSIPSFAEIRKWQAPKKDLQKYLNRVRNLLNSASVSLLARSDIPYNLQKIYATLIPAIAWQESCFRQFVVKDKKLTYLLSYNKSSVGIMQVNERVWRGLYDRQRLRWDIRYNAFVGCEIADRYIKKYILRKSGPAILKDQDTLAHLVYAMYNGGPGQYAKYLERKKKGEHYKSDRLFSEKYNWVKSEEWEKIDNCL